MKKIFACLFLFIFFSGCGYHLVGTASYEKTVSLSGKKVAVITFANRVDEPEVESIFTRALTNELLQTGKLELVPKETADYVITGEVVLYNKETMTVNEKGDVLTYRLTLGVNVKVKDKTGKVIVSYNNLSDYEDYKVYEDIEKTKDAEREAVRKISESLSQMIVSLLL